ncbi:DUF2313 domain-containing protein [Pseudomonas arsenicoxydans]|uniref:DUF2313 domain-containing protein n=1 Tax=Pseudomonas arsenicoxydans TaxID=702115 RepID=A0A502HR98_9PSED|nr:DUF2313 domain-containing protein [Pseudomonas arsenicoxydans]TPG76303.1 DUF2313 domain-containing protein [Pseudomonas arsenicoxydans]
MKTTIGYDAENYDAENYSATFELKNENLEMMAALFVDHLPDGLAWDSKRAEGSNTRGLVKAVSAEFVHLFEQIETLSDEINIRKTIVDIGDWETSVGIPSKNSCMDERSLELADRRLEVEARISRRTTVTLAEVNTAAQVRFPYLKVVFRPGVEVEGNLQPPGPERHKIYVRFSDYPWKGFDYRFPFRFGLYRNKTAECFIHGLIQANVYIVFQYW